VERELEQTQPKQLTSGVTEAELEPIQGEVVHTPPQFPPETHLTATDPAEMAASRDNMRAWLEQRLTIIERDIVEANAALNEARKNGWATAALTSARNRAVDEEMFYNKILAAVEAGHTIIPDFPIQVFAVRADREKPEQQGWMGMPEDTYLNRAAQSSCLPAGAGDYRNPAPEVQVWSTGMRQDREGKEYRHWMQRRTGRPVGPIFFPSMTARSPVMRATAAAMKDKVFDQIGVCHPNITVGAERRVETAGNRVGDPLVIGQILRKKVGSKQRCVSFIIAWHLNLEDL
jgi:hypothetical protein